MSTFYFATSYGRFLRVQADGPTWPRIAATAALQPGERILEVQTEAEYAARNAAFNRTHCRHCGEPKALCGGWCAHPEAYR